MTANLSCSATAPPGSPNLATANWPEATPIVDPYHARQHLHDLAKPLEPILGDAHADWLAARLADLDSGDIETLVNQTARLPLTGDTATDTTKALAYFKTNAHRMRLLPRARHVHRLLCCGSRLQSRDRPTPQTVWHALEHPGSNA